MNQGTLVFSHANGFGAGCYRILFETWRAAGWEVHALPRIGHDPAYPVTSNWPHLRDQLIHFIEREVKPQMQVDGPVMLAGHSLGGMLSLLVACRRPDLVEGLLMLDSPVVSGWRAHSVRMAKATRLMPRVSPGKISSQRRHEWPTRAAVQEHFAAKHKFARWDPRVLADYVASGFEEQGDKTRLAFQREIETRIYNTLPHHLPALLRRHPPRCPIGFVAGTQSEELRQAGAAASKALARQHFRWMEGSHLYPFERPDDTAALVLQMLDELRAARATSL
ncbi:alpha/beta hydrolase [Paucibacter sp. O1-1]|uniref:alpha/beta hydrolase n=1 Tax=Paucibacter sp. M5-1 TaxID=3015998 RepID=UPI0021D4CF8E|nr:alpha/beta hydrolase [Paucibacter sp. M5-1]MCU7375286.1 alpha/beta hydrolase [Paucibacter sp. O1-1]MCZ7884455.1 alpha/beta hydrolase [Paucibacter sp. M5-1]MDA3830293.1 alpha/beta hydrolase [Paucibacter sp. O1-1]